MFLKRKATPQTDQSPDTRQKLIQAAKSIFAQRGYSGSTVQEIVKKAGVNVSLVSYHFQGKEGLLRACLEQFANERFEATNRILKPAVNTVSSKEELKTRVMLFCEDFIRFHLEEPELCMMIQREAFVHETLASCRQRFIDSYFIVVEFFTQAQEKKLIKKNLDTNILATLLHGSLIGLLKWDAIRKEQTGESLNNPIFLESSCSALVNTLLEGALTANPTEKNEGTRI